VPNKKPLAIRLAPLTLILVAAVWGGAFVVMKTAIEHQPIVDFLGTRFVIATLAMILVKPSVLKQLRGPILWQGLVLGLLMAIAYFTQTVGLQLTTAAIAGFVTGLYVVLSPLFIWIFLRKRAGGRIWLGVALATVGLAVISINLANFSFEWSQLWLVACAVFFSLHITGLAHWSPKQDAYALTVIQLAVMGIVNTGAAFLHGYHAPVGFDGWFAIIFTAIFSTAIAFFVQTWAQGVMDSSRVAIYLTSETVFAAGIAVMIGQEVLKLQTIIGGALIVGAMLAVEWPTKNSRGMALPVETMPH